METTEDVETLLPNEWPGSYFLGEEEIRNVVEVLEARSPFRFYGPDLQHYADRLEDAYRRRLGRRHALAVNSGTSALAIALGALGLGPGDEVLIPGYLWVSCVAAIVRAGAMPRLVEVNDTFCMDPADLERKLTAHSRAVLIVHMSGATGDLDDLLAVARQHDLRVIEDAAQANGASFRGKPLGSFGDVAVFSFQLNKNITAGEGGLVACDDDRLHRRAVALHDLGYGRNAQGRLETDDPDVQLWGIGARMSELTAAVLVAQEAKLDGIVARMRGANHQLYGGLAGVAGAVARRVPDPAGDSGPFVLLTWPTREVCLEMVARTRARGVRPGPDGIGNVPLSSFGLHLYYNNASLVHRRGVNGAGGGAGGGGTGGGGTGADGTGYPWNAPENAFARDYRYGQGSLPHTDDLFARSSILTVPPVLETHDVQRILDIFVECAAELGT